MTQAVPSEQGLVAHERAKLKSWLRERLTGDRGRADWRMLIEAGWDRLLALPLDAVLPLPAVEAFVDAHLKPEILAELVRPVVRSALASAIDEMRRDQRPLSRVVPHDAEAALTAMVSRPGFVHADWIRAIFKEAAIEGIVGDTLYRALRDFSTIVPRLVMGMLTKVKIPVIGTAGALGGKVMEEIEKLLEPEIKSFLGTGTKKALERAAEYTTAHLEDPSSVEFRKNIVRFVLSKPPAFHALPLSDSALRDIDAAAVKIARRIAELPETRTEVRAFLGRVAKTQGPRTLRVIVEDLGIHQRPAFDAWAQLTWPMLVEQLREPRITGWLDGLVDELLEKAAAGVPSAPPPPPTFPPGSNWGDALKDDEKLPDVPSKEP
jgi:hypothetical protein